jgi:hypothetical protein
VLFQCSKKKRTKSQTNKIGEEITDIRNQRRKGQNRRRKSSIYGLLELRYVVGERNMVHNGTCNLAKKEEEDGYRRKEEENMREIEKVLFNKLKE